MPPAGAVIRHVVLVLAILFVLGVPAYAVLSPLLSQGAFVFTGWHFGYSAFGTGRF